MAYQLTSLGISVLALLRERPMHGYEMFQTLVERHADRIVKVRPGSLYHVVDRLTEEKLIRRAATGREGEAPERVHHAITGAGGWARGERGGGRGSGPSVSSTRSPTPVLTRSVSGCAS